MYRYIYIGPMIRIGREIQCLPYAKGKKKKKKITLPLHKKINNYATFLSLYRSYYPYTPRD